MIKLIVSDLDGTLLDHGKNISERDAHAVRRSMDSGFEFCIASGRMYAEINIFMKPFEHRYHALGQNGATIYTKDQNLVGSTEFSPDLSSRLLRISQAYKDFIHFVHCTNDSYYSMRLDESTYPYESRIMTACEERADLEAALAADEMRCSKISFFGDLDRLRLFEAELNRLFEGKIETFISDKDCLDIMPRNVSKGAGLLELIKKLGLQPHEIACIGDSFNDLSMFAITPHSYAMSGSDNEIRCHASHVVDSVADAIEHIMHHNLACT